jgi:predicted component of type VI protein secretion system
MKAELVPENGDPPIPIRKDVTVIGRREYCDVQINHDSLSKRHCVVVKTDGLLVIRDLVTTNGTKVKGQKVRWAALLPDDRIAFGAYKLRVYLGPDHVLSPSEVWRAGGGGGAGAGQTIRQARPAGVAASLNQSETTPQAPAPRVALATPSPMSVPIVPPDDDVLEILDDDSDDSGWRNLIAGAGKPDLDDDVIIELD